VILQVADGGLGAADSCSLESSPLPMYLSSTADWGDIFGGWATRDDCLRIPAYPICGQYPQDNMQELCQWSFDTGFRYACVSVLFLPCKPFIIIPILGDFLVALPLQSPIFARYFSQLLCCSCFSITCIFLGDYYDSCLFRWPVPASSIWPPVCTDLTNLAPFLPVPLLPPNLALLLPHFDALWTAPNPTTPSPTISLVARHTRVSPLWYRVGEMAMLASTLSPLSRPLQCLHSPIQSGLQDVHHVNPLSVRPQNPLSLQPSPLRTHPLPNPTTARNLR